MGKEILGRWPLVVGGFLLVLAVVALVAVWDVVERIWLRLQFRGRRESFELQSETVGDTFTVHVCLPRDHTPERAYPLIVVLDGDSDALPMAGAAARQGVEAIVVGVGYGSDEADARERDYTPFVAPEIDWAPSGGGEVFYTFLVKELLPEVEDRHRTLGTGRRVLAGHSLAGLATVYAVLNSPERGAFFDGYIAASPTLPLAEGAIFDIERTTAEDRTDMPGVLFLSVGGRESAEMRQAMADLASTLEGRAYPGLAVHTLVRRGRGHGGNNWRSYADGVRMMYERGVLSSAEPEIAVEPPIPPERLIEWKPGVEGGIPEAEVQITLSADDLAGKRGAARVIQEAIDHLAAPGAILLPPGTFTVTTRLVLKDGVVLRGSGAQETYLVFDMPDETWRGGISIAGQPSYQQHTIAGGAESGSIELELEDAAGLEAGQTILVFSENDPDVMYTDPRWDADWARQSLGQIVRVVEVTGNRATIDVPLRLTYKAELEPRVRVLRPIAGAGVEDLHLRRVDQAEDSIIYVQEAVNCWVRNVVSQDCMRAHIWIADSRFVTVEGSYFHHAWNYGGGGHGYGVVAGRHATDCLVTNNAFEHLRHSMMVKEGANGNVFSYNYSVDNVELCDISIHGHYSYMNLFEGNDVQYVQYADYWGPTGPLTTMYRNRVATTIKVNDHSHRANLVGNTVSSIRISGGSEDVLGLAQ